MTITLLFDGHGPKNFPFSGRNGDINRNTMPSIAMKQHLQVSVEYIWRFRKPLVQLVCQTGEYERIWRNNFIGRMKKRQPVNDNLDDKPAFRGTNRTGSLSQILRISGDLHPSLLSALRSTLPCAVADRTSWCNAGTIIMRRLRRRQALVDRCYRDKACEWAVGRRLNGELSMINLLRADVKAWTNVLKRNTYINTGHGREN